MHCVILLFSLPQSCRADSNNAHTLSFSGMYTVSILYSRTYHKSFICDFLISHLILLKVNGTVKQNFIAIVNTSSMCYQYHIIFYISEILRQSSLAVFRVVPVLSKSLVLQMAERKRFFTILWKLLASASRAFDHILSLCYSPFIFQHYSSINFIYLLFYYLFSFNVCSILFHLSIYFYTFWH